MKTFPIVGRIGHKYKGKLSVAVDVTIFGANQTDRRVEMSVTVRLLKPDDETVWLLLWQAYLDFYRTVLSGDTTRNTWQNIIQSVDVKGFGAFDADNRMVGFAHIVIHPNTWNIGKCCYLEDLFVDADCRRQGAARSLIEAVYQFAAAEGLNRVYWSTHADNLTAQSLYNQMAHQTDMVQYRKDFPNG